MALAGHARTALHREPADRLDDPIQPRRRGGIDIGAPGPLPQQEHLGDFWIPQRGLFVIGQAFFEPLDPTRHRCDVSAGR